MNKINKVNSYPIKWLLFLVSILFASGGYDHGTSTGKGKLQIDLTLNPCNYFENGQNYIVVGYGITNKFDLHGYYADHSNYHNGVDSYYYGLFYQFLDSKYIDLATAIGSRKMMDLNYSHIFYPQFLYNVKLGKDYTIGGSIVKVNKKIKSQNIEKNNWIAFDISFFIPITQYFTKIKQIDYVKLGIGAFHNNIKDNINIKYFLPTYSIDIKFKSIYELK